MQITDHRTNITRAGHSAIEVYVTDRSVLVIAHNSADIDFIAYHGTGAEAVCYGTGMIMTGNAANGVIALDQTTAEAVTDSTAQVISYDGTGGVVCTDIEVDNADVLNHATVQYIADQSDKVPFRLDKVQTGHGHIIAVKGANIANVLLSRQIIANGRPQAEFSIIHSEIRLQNIFVDDDVVHQLAVDGIIAAVDFGCEPVQLTGVVDLIHTVLQYSRLVGVADRAEAVDVAVLPYLTLSLTADRAGLCGGAGSIEPVVTGGCNLVCNIAVATDHTGVGCIAGIGAGRSGYHGVVNMRQGGDGCTIILSACTHRDDISGSRTRRCDHRTPQLCVAVKTILRSDRTTVGISPVLHITAYRAIRTMNPASADPCVTGCLTIDCTANGASLCSGAGSVEPVVAGGCNLVCNVAVATAGASVSGETSLSTSRRSYNSIVAVNMVYPLAENAHILIVDVTHSGIGGIFTDATAAAASLIIASFGTTGHLLIYDNLTNNTIRRQISCVLRPFDIATADAIGNSIVPTETCRKIKCDAVMTQYTAISLTAEGASLGGGAGSINPVVTGGCNLVCNIAVATGACISCITNFGTGRRSYNSIVAMNMGSQIAENTRTIVVDMVYSGIGIHYINTASAPVELISLR